MEHNRIRSEIEMLSARREQLTAKMCATLILLSELEKNIANTDGATDSTRAELQISRDELNHQFNAQWSEREQLGVENNQ